MEKAIYGANAVLLFLIARHEYNSDSDKTFIISLTGFLILLILNLLLGLSAQFDKKPIYKHYYYSALGLLIGAVTLFSLW